MTRSYLIELARTIKIRNTRSFQAPGSDTLVVYDGRFKNCWIHCVYCGEKCVAIYYKKVFYAVNKVSVYEAPILKELYARYFCTTKVFLYSNPRLVMFVDERGTEHYTNEYNPRKNDYADLIPLRSTLNVHA